ncbi:major facilitator superfamily domain-containing protein [Xylariales sp. PMI_506]|nr:major facilitator superfamily domain-containing protein [Xylariales sp. PMI_506]
MVDGEASEKDVPSDSTTAETVQYPEGGWRAWGVVLGSWFALFGSMGIMNSIGTYQTYIGRNQLQDYSTASVSWIFGVYCGIAFFGAIQVGPIFDARGARVLIGCSGVCTVLFLMLLGVCTQYWHFMLVFGVLGGISLALAFSPAISIVAHYFNKKRGMATGIASSGGSVGGVMWPLVMQRLYPEVGFAWATRIAAFICLFTFSMAVLLIRERFPPKPLSMRRVLPDLTIFKNHRLLLTSMGAFFMEWGLFVPLSYLTSYALDHGLDSSFSYLLLALINAGAVPGRCIPGYLADRLGRFNVLILTIFGCGLSVACFWLTSGSSVALLAIFALVFGFFSGSNVSLAPVCIGQLCSIDSYGRYYATANVLISIRYVINWLFDGSTLTSIPIAGEIFSRSQGDYRNLIIFTIVSYAASFLSLVLAKIACCGSRNLWVVY